MDIRRVQQISESHCGPAVLEMLLEAVGVEIDQDEVREAAQISEDKLEEYGMRIDQIALASVKLAPHIHFWYKYSASLDDIRYLLSRGYAVAVEWQGLFYGSEEEESQDIGDEDLDFGHYSVVVNVDDDADALIIVDPYKDFADQNRIVEIPVFMHRWWDTNEVEDPYSGKKEIVEDYRVLFFVAPHWEQFPPERKFEKFL
ncbi:MAG: hypothetical protein BroJett025_09920 [Patescibacteria group bacterium]|nr:MAG: hypothetical protein BroJett025_09920 [Patescibacteria group bacterium]